MRVPPDVPTTKPKVDVRRADLLIVAALQIAGLLTPEAASQLVGALGSIVPLDYGSAYTALQGMLDSLQSYQWCEQCRSLHFNYANSLQNHHNAGHPLPEGQE